MMWKFACDSAPVLVLTVFAVGCYGQHAHRRTERVPIAPATPGGESAADDRGGWLSWRGPQQNGTSLQKGLPDRVSVDGEAPSWTYELAGRGTPVIAEGRVYALGYEGEGPALEEVLACLDEKTGRKIWERRWSDFLSDIIYHRFSIGSPTIDPETGNVLTLSAAGLLTCWTANGEQVWQRCMMSEYGRLTFPNGRTGAPLIDGDLVIVHVATAAWGKYGPARDRFYAFDKRTGTPIWSSTPGGPPKDASFSFPVVATVNDRRVLYAGLAGGHLVCVDVRSGDPLWKFQMSIGGMSSSPVLYKDRVIATHGKENLDTSTIGRMVALPRTKIPEFGQKQIVLTQDDEIWRNHLTAFTSSPVLVGDRIYQTVSTGELHCVDADSGRGLWHVKLAPDQIHASPAWGDGKLYVPMNNGTFHILEPDDDGPNVRQTVQLAGNCLGAPAITNGRVYVHTTERLYCFTGRPGIAARPARAAEASSAEPGEAVRLQIIPGDIVLRQGEKMRFAVRSLDANGLVVAHDVDASWGNVPADGVEMDAHGVLQIGRGAAPVATMLQASAGGLKGSARLRIVRDVGYVLDFEHAKPSRVAPRHWIGAGPKWEIMQHGDDGMVLARRLDNPLFQRTMSFIGHPAMKKYTMCADICSDGNRRMMSIGGVVNQRYLIALKGNYQALEVTSNQELLKASVPFRWKPGRWYRLKTRVDMADDGAAVVRAKAWPRDQQEPANWTIEVKDPHGHSHGSPGVYGFTPQSRFRVYLDNISVTAND